MPGVTPNVNLDCADHVVVAVLTFRRVDDLLGMLPAVLEQTERLPVPGTVIVVDNDPGGSAHDAVASFGGRVRYVSEPEPGIAAARNRAIREAEQAAAIVFIDDDELPNAGWLDLLVGWWQGTGCDAVTGPVVSMFNYPLDPWVAASGHFDTWTYGDGTTVPAAATNNLLLDLRTLRRLELEFRPAYGLSGGSDSRLTHELVKRGGRIVWAAQAIVTEQVPIERGNRRWVKSRIMRTANAWVRVRLDLAPSPTRRFMTRISCSARGFALIFRGLIVAAIGVVSGSLRKRAVGVSDIARGRGLVMGSFGMVVVEYRR